MDIQSYLLFLKTPGAFTFFRSGKLHFTLNQKLQDMGLPKNLDVYSSIFLGREKLKKALGFINVLDHDYMLSESRNVLNSLEVEIPSLKNNIRVLW